MDRVQSFRVANPDSDVLDPTCEKKPDPTAMNNIIRIMPMKNNSDPEIGNILYLNVQPGSGFYIDTWIRLHNPVYYLNWGIFWLTLSRRITSWISFFCRSCWLSSFPFSLSNSFWVSRTFLYVHMYCYLITNITA